MGKSMYKIYDYTCKCRRYLYIILEVSLYLYIHVECERGVSWVRGRPGSVRFRTIPCKAPPSPPPRSRSTAEAGWDNSVGVAGSRSSPAGAAGSWSPPSSGGSSSAPWLQTISSSLLSMSERYSTDPTPSPPHSSDTPLSAC